MKYVLFVDGTFGSFEVRAIQSAKVICIILQTLSKLISHKTILLWTFSSWITCFPSIGGILCRRFFAGLFARYSKCSPETFLPTTILPSSLAYSGRSDLQTFATSSDWKGVFFRSHHLFDTSQFLYFGFVIPVLYFYIPQVMTEW